MPEGLPQHGATADLDRSYAAQLQSESGLPPIGRPAGLTASCPPLPSLHSQEGLAAGSSARLCQLGPQVGHDGFIIIGGGVAPAGAASHAVEVRLDLLEIVCKVPALQASEDHA